MAAIALLALTNITTVHTCVHTDTHLTHTQTHKTQDPIHPEYVLQAPFEVFSFQYNPSNPEIIAAGCYNGQVCVCVWVVVMLLRVFDESRLHTVISHFNPNKHTQVVLWDTTHEHERIARMKAASSKQEMQDAGDDAAIPVVKYK